MRRALVVLAVRRAQPAVLVAAARALAEHPAAEALADLAAHHPHLLAAAPAVPILGYRHGPSCWPTGRGSKLITVSRQLTNRFRLATAHHGVALSPRCPIHL